MTQQEQIYLKGFIDKCAEYGMDPQSVAKSAGAGWEGAGMALPMILGMGAGQLANAAAPGSGLLVSPVVGSYSSMLWNGPGVIAGMLAKSRTPEEQAASSEHTLLNLLPGVAAYNMTQRLKVQDALEDLVDKDKGEDEDEEESEDREKKKKKHKKESTKEAYWAGFTSKCAEYNLDPAFVVKLANTTTQLLNTAAREGADIVHGLASKVPEAAKAVERVVEPAVETARGGLNSLGDAFEQALNPVTEAAETVVPKVTKTTKAPAVDLTKVETGLKGLNKGQKNITNKIESTGKDILSGQDLITEQGAENTGKILKGQEGLAAGQEDINNTLKDMLARGDLTEEQLQNILAGSDTMIEALTDLTQSGKLSVEQLTELLKQQGLQGDQLNQVLSGINNQSTALDKVKNIALSGAQRGKENSKMITQTQRQIQEARKANEAAHQVTRQSVDEAARKQRMANYLMGGGMTALGAGELYNILQNRQGA